MVFVLQRQLLSVLLIASLAVATGKVVQTTYGPVRGLSKPNIDTFWNIP